MQLLLGTGRIRRVECPAYAMPGKGSPGVSRKCHVPPQPERTPAGPVGKRNVSRLLRPLLHFGSGHATSEVEIPETIRCATPALAQREKHHFEHPHNCKHFKLQCGQGGCVVVFPCWRSACCWSDETSFGRRVRISTLRAQIACFICSGRRQGIYSIQFGVYLWGQERCLCVPFMYSCPLVPPWPVLFSPTFRSSSPEPLSLPCVQSCTLCCPEHF